MRNLARRREMKGNLLALTIIAISIVNIFAQAAQVSSSNCEQFNTLSGAVPAPYASPPVQVEHSDSATVVPEKITSNTITPEEMTSQESLDEESKYEHYYVYLTYEEEWALACLIWLESRGESIECQKAVASVVINRYVLDPYKYPTLFDVIYEEGQFSPAKFIESTTPDDLQLSIAHEVAKFGPTIPEYVTYFRSKYYHEFTDLVDFKNIDDTYFSYSESLKDAIECGGASNDYSTGK